MTPLDMTDTQVQFDQDVVINGIDLQLEAGSITGLLGRNGSGKSTLIRSALGLCGKNTGTSKVFGELAGQISSATRQRVGYVAQHFSGFENHKVRNCLNLVGSFYRSWDRGFVDTLRDHWQIDPLAKIGHLSPGQQQQIAILLAIGHRPDLLILDEPVANLDPAARRDFLRELIKLEATQTVLISSHIVSDLERIVSHVAILHKGRLVVHDELDDTKESVCCVTLKGSNLPLQLSEPSVLAYSARDQQAQAWVTGWSDAKIAELGVTYDANVQAQHHNLEDLFIGVTS